jgi:hypothetical protein
LGGGASQAGELMRTEIKQRIQVVLAIAIGVAAVRLAYTFYARHESEMTQPAKKVAPPLNPDAYVTPKKLYPYDVESARQLTQQPVWVKVGYSITYFPYSAGRTEFSREAGRLLPIQKLNIKDVVTATTPGSAVERQIMAVFAQEGKNYAFSIGAVRQGNYRFYADEMLFIQDPHELYKHWSPEVWEAIDKHEVKLGMSELQADFALGLGIPEDRNPPGDRILKYPNGGKPVQVRYERGKAVEVKVGA